MVRAFFPQMFNSPQRRNYWSDPKNLRRMQKQHGPPVSSCQVCCMEIVGHAPAVDEKC